MSDDDNRPVGFLGRLRSAKALAWVLIVGLVAATASGLAILVAVLGG